MKIFFDTEFTGLHQDTSLISIGLVSEDGKKFYAELTDYKEDQVNDWLKDNVIKHLWVNTSTAFDWDLPDWFHVGGKHKIRKELKMYFDQFDSVELVSDVSHYDMVLLIGLFGTAFDLPKNVCPVCYDINQDIASYHHCDQETAFNISREDILRSSNIEVPGEKHNALYDALVIKEVYNIVSGR